MRNLTLTYVVALFLISFSIFAKDVDSCSKLFNYNVDEMTDEKSYTLKKPIILAKDDKKGIAISVMIIDKKFLPVFIYMMAVGGSNCVDKDAKAIFLFKDGKKIKILNQLSFNCDNKTGWLLNKKDISIGLFQKFTTTYLKAIRIYKHDYSYVQEKLTKKQQIKLKKVFKCTLKYAK